MARHPDDNDDGVRFDALTLAASGRGRPGPAPRDDSQRALVASGQAKWLKSALPTSLHKRLHIEAVRRDTTASDLVAEALEAYLGSAFTDEPREPSSAPSARTLVPTKRISHASAHQPSGWEDEGVEE
jgi:hypothetical protein